MSCKTQGCLDVMTCQCEQRSAEADTRAATIAEVCAVGSPDLARPHPAEELT